ncbi:tetratricopeptide repeat protein 8 [Lycorma delicatula]|uniref:tetratricopeptide repeat protein 8 n=1 Tax=Lycorma delicatula TaxID=130591 RepID=UPI003F50D84E
MKLDPFYEALSHYRRRNYEKCATICTELLEKNPYDQAIWALKMKSMTADVMVDDIEAEEEGIADVMLDNDTIAQAPRPGTSLRTATTAHTPGQAFRPRGQSGRPISGVVRPGTQSGLATSLEQALKTPRTAHSARPITSQSARSIRLGTASMLSQPDGPFIQVARLNLVKYASMDNISKSLFQYIYYHENDIRNAMDLAVEATKACQFNDWWWKVQLGKCYFLLGLIRDAEQQLRSALRQTPTIETFLRLARVYLRLDQPLSALDVCRAGLDSFPQEITLMTEVARILEGLNNIPSSIKYYKEILQNDATNIEAIACIGVNHFYCDQPELALRFYRRLLQMGLYNAELFNNLGLSCFYAQQYDMTISCFERALSLAIDENAADIWYNIAHVAIVIGELKMAIQCLHLAISIDRNHAPAYNNLAVLEYRRGNHHQAKGYLQAAASLTPYLFEPHYNYAIISNNVGDLQTSYVVVQKGLKAYPAHCDSNTLLKELNKHFTNL